MRRSVFKKSRKISPKPAPAPKPVVYNTAGKPPKDYVQKRGTWWCPYCREGRKFVRDGSVGVKRCEVCGISENDFYVRQMNHLWGVKK